MYLLMGHTAKFAMELLIYSGIVAIERLKHHESVGP